MKLRIKLDDNYDKAVKLRIKLDDNYDKAVKLRIKLNDNYDKAMKLRLKLDDLKKELREKSKKVSHYFRSADKMQMQYEIEKQSSAA